jgi:putative phage-type endonuclease
MKRNLIFTSTDGMSNRDWLQFRTRGLGASDIGAVLGFSEYCSPMQKFDEKITLIPKPKFENIAMFLGKQAEDKNAEMWEYWDGSIEGMIENYYSGKKIRRCRKINAYVQNPKYNWLFVSLDRIINKHTIKGQEFGEGALELKNLSSYEVQKWEEGIPTSYLLQVQTQMLVCCFEYGELAIKQDDRNYTVYPFEKNKAICEQIIEQTHEFWQRVEKARKIQTQIYNAKQNFNLRLVEDLEAKLQELEPEPDGTDAVTDFLSYKYKKGIAGERAGTKEELQWAITHAEKKEALKIVQTQLLEAENKIKNSMREVEVLNFGKEGKVYWTNSKIGSRIFRNKIK